MSKKDRSKEASFMACAYRGEKEEEKEERGKKINKYAKASF